MLILQDCPFGGLQHKYFKIILISGNIFITSISKELTKVQTQARLDGCSEEPGQGENIPAHGKELGTGCSFRSILTQNIL